MLSTESTFRVAIPYEVLWLTKAYCRLLDCIGSQPTPNLRLLTAGLRGGKLPTPRSTPLLNACHIPTSHPLMVNGTMISLSLLFRKACRIQAIRTSPSTIRGIRRTYVFEKYVLRSGQLIGTAILISSTSLAIQNTTSRAVNERVSWTLTSKLPAHVPTSRYISTLKPSQSFGTGHRSRVCRLPTRHMEAMVSYL